jgi:uncharacterized coiled-coil DUF342 family protein
MSGAKPIVDRSAEKIEQLSEALRETTEKRAAAEAKHDELYKYTLKIESQNGEYLGEIDALKRERDIYIARAAALRVTLNELTAHDEYLDAHEEYRE